MTKRRLLTVLLSAAAAAAIGLAIPRNSPGSLAGKPNGGSPANATRGGFGPRHVWRLSDDAITDLHHCAGSSRLDCVRKVMRRHGASPGAFEFYRRTGWFLSDLKDIGGPVVVATLVNPWRANENAQPALVGGTPAVVYPEKVKVIVENDPGFKALQAESPRLLFWKSGPTFEASTITADGVSIVFRYRLLDGCHACPVRGWARIEFVFSPRGIYRRAKLLDVVHD
jgi:hypothetical protein